MGRSPFWSLTNKLQVVEECREKSQEFGGSSLEQ